MAVGGTAGRLRRREFLTRFLGNTLLAAGGSLVGAAAAYQIYANRAEAGLDGLKRGTIDFAPTAAARAISATAAPSTAPETAAGQATAPATEVASAPASSAATGEPAVFAAQTPAVPAADTPPGMMPVKLRIQSIGLMDARVVEVGTRVENGQLVWVTADHAVGHHVGTALPGQAGNLVLSGHISSPVRGEGSIFKNLPNLKDKLGSRVSVQTADGGWYHYEIKGTDVVLPADIWVLGPTPAPVVTLLTCVPDGVYTYRFVARGEFVGRG